jgi:hypothetical protein
MSVILKCEVCGEVLPDMDAADKHEYNATMTDPENRDHWVMFVPAPEPEDPEIRDRRLDGLLDEEGSE